jgi:putative transposase
LGVSASAYYKRATGQRSARAVEDERLLGVIRATHEANYLAYGYRRMHKALRRAGERAGRCRVQRLMASNGIVGAKRRGKPWRTTKPDPNAARPKDLVQRNFAADAPDRLWVGDFTYLRCWEGIVYFSFVIDVFSRMVVGWQLAANMRSTLVLDALRMAIGTRQPAACFELVHHTDAGSQYTSFDYTQELDDHEVLRSIGTVGDAYDNAMAESFVDTFKTELIADRVWRTRSQLELAVVQYIGWFNHRRLHESLGDIPPVEYEQLHASVDRSLSEDESVPALSPDLADRLTQRRSVPLRTALALEGEVGSKNGPVDRTLLAQAACRQASDESTGCGLSDLRVEIIHSHNNKKTYKPSLRGTRSGSLLTLRQSALRASEFAAWANRVFMYADGCRL